jgi:hypothetical protein
MQVTSRAAKTETILTVAIRRFKGVTELGCRSGNWFNREKTPLISEKSAREVVRSVRCCYDIELRRLCPPISRIGIPADERYFNAAGASGDVDLVGK